MAEAGQKPEKANPVPHAGDHDRVVMLSLNADGTANQHNPEFIGSKEEVETATKVQFAQQAVSAVDVAERGVGGGTVELGDPDPSIQALKEKHEAAEKAGEAAAEKAVSGLFKD